MSEYMISVLIEVAILMAATVWAVYFVGHACSDARTAAADKKTITSQFVIGVLPLFLYVVWWIWYASNSGTAMMQWVMFLSG